MEKREKKSSSAVPVVPFKVPLKGETNGTPKTPAQRLAAARENLGVTQKAMSATTGIPVSSLNKYEGDHSQPGTEALAQLARAGINIHWLVTGDGPMLIKELQPHGALDAPLLQACIEGVEEALRSARREMAPAKKAGLVLAVYDLYAGAAAPLDKVRVLHLVKTAMGGD